MRSLGKTRLICLLPETYEDNLGWETSIISEPSSTLWRRFLCRTLMPNYLK